VHDFHENWYIPSPLVAMMIALGDLVQTLSCVLRRWLLFSQWCRKLMKPDAVPTAFLFAKCSQTTTIAISSPNNIDFKNYIKSSRSWRNPCWDTSTLTSGALHSYAVASPTKLKMHYILQLRLTRDECTTEELDIIRPCQLFILRQLFVSDIAIFVLKRDVKLQLTN